MRGLMQEAGHELVTPSLTGLGKRSHLASPSVDLDTHISDVCNAMFYEDLRDICLIGHSYGGMVATGVLDRMQERIARVVYVDAFVPRDGESLADLWNEDFRQSKLDETKKTGEGWRVPANPLPPDTPADEAEWLTARRQPQPLGTLTTPLRLTRPVEVPRAYVYCTITAPHDPFRRFYERAQTEAGWTAHELRSSHNPHITIPEELAALLIRIAAG